MIVLIIKIINIINLQFRSHYPTQIQILPIPVFKSIKNIENKTILIKFPDNLSFTDGTNIFKFSELYNGEYKESDIVGRYNGKDQYNYISYEFYREEWIISVFSSKINNIILLTSSGNNNFDINTAFPII